jgi:Zn-dependent oligopeptidase
MIHGSLRRGIYCYSSIKHHNRLISSYIKDVFRTGSLFPTNPLLDAFGTTTAIAKPPLSETRLPLDFSKIQPYHVPKAAQTIRRDYERHMAELLLLFPTTNQNSASSTTTTDAHASEALRHVVERLDQIQTPIDSLRQISNLLSVVSAAAAEKQSWRTAENGMESELDKSKSEPQVASSEKATYDFLTSLVQQHGKNDKDDILVLVAAARRWIQSYQQRTGIGLFLISSENNRIHQQKEEEYQMLSSALHELHLRFQSSSSNNKKKNRAATYAMGDMYNGIGIRNRQAELLGYRANHAARVMASQPRMACIPNIQSLHTTVSQKVLGFLASQPQMDAFVANASTRSPTNESTTPPPPSLLRLEDHVTLDGALVFVEHLMRDLLDVVVVEAVGCRTGWHKDVRLFHVFCANDDDGRTENEDTSKQNRHIGSFYLDPFRRSGKLDRPFASPLLLSHGSNDTHMVMGVSLTLEEPAWDTEPCFLTWDDAEALFHEMGHVYQCLLARRHLKMMPFDLSEFLPKVNTSLHPAHIRTSCLWHSIVRCRALLKNLTMFGFAFVIVSLRCHHVYVQFMEHWLMERSTVYALIDLSKSEVPLSDEEIDGAFSDRSREKAFRLAQQTYYGSLELALFSNFDIHGQETILELNHRLAAELVPHDIPNEKDITALLDIFRENSSGRDVCWYRYLWCDVLSATVFDRFKHVKMSEDASSMQQAKKAFRQLIVNPVAAMKTEEINQEFDLTDMSAEALFKQYRLS